METNQNVYEQTLAVIQRYGAKQDMLHRILLDLQDASGLNYISPEVSDIVAEQLGMTPAKMYEVLTFYSMLHSTPQARYLIEACTSTPCYFNKSKAVLEALERELGVKPGVPTEDGLFVYYGVPCFGACDVSPAVKVNHVVHGPMDTPEKIAALLRDLRAEAQRGGAAL